MNKEKIVAETLVKSAFGEGYFHEAKQKIGKVLLKAGDSWLDIYDISRRSRFRIGYANAEIEDLVQDGLVESKILPGKDVYRSARHYKLKENYSKVLKNFLEKSS